MKQIFLILLFFTAPLFGQRGNDIIYVPSDNTLLVSQTSGRTGFYVGGQYFTHYPFYYNNPAPYALLNRFGIEYRMMKDISIMVGGYSKNQGIGNPPNQVRPEVWGKVRICNTLTQEINNIDVVGLVKVSQEFHYGLGVFVKW